MKKNKFTLYIISALLLGSLGYVLAKPDSDSINPTSENNATPSKKIESVQQNNQGDFTTEYRNNIYKNAVGWMKSAMNINDDTGLSREQKNSELVDLLKKNQDDPIATREIIVSLSNLNPIEAIDEILPFLNNTDENIQNAAIGALNNAMMLTESELAQKRQMPENDIEREKIAPAIRELLQNKTLSPNTKDVVLSSYASTNPSIEDTRYMLQSLLKSDSISNNAAGYLASTILNGKEMANTIRSLDSKNHEYKSAVLSELSTNIVANPIILEVLDPASKKQLHDFIIKNPPTCRSQSFSNQNDEWKMALNSLEL